MCRRGQVGIYNSNRPPTGLLQLQQGSCSSNAAPAASNCSYTRVALGLIDIQPFCAIAHSLGASQLIVLLSQLWDQRCRAPTAPTWLLVLRRGSYNFNEAPAVPNYSYKRVALGLISLQSFCAIVRSLGMKSADSNSKQT